jgi:hypothetical protein
MTAVPVEPAADPAEPIEGHRRRLPSRRTSLGRHRRRLMAGAALAHLTVIAVAVAVLQYRATGVLMAVMFSAIYWGDRLEASA